MANRRGKSGSTDRFDFGGFRITADGDHSHEIKRLASWKESYDKAQIMNSLLPDSDSNWGKPLDHSGMTYIKSIMIIQWK